MPSNDALYRTRWLMAHNRLHSICHTEDMDGWVLKKFLESQWEEYLDELKTAEDVASEPA